MTLATPTVHGVEGFLSGPQPSPASMADQLGGGPGTPDQPYGRGKRIALVLGPVLFVALLALPTLPGLDPTGQRVLALTLWMAAWWMTEAVPLGATSLLPLVALPLLGVVDIGTAAAAYAEPTIFLFMGGFFLAGAFQKWDLHRRFALSVLARVGARPRRLILASMVVTAGLSMWVSNTATAVMMLPIGLAIAMEAGGGGRSGSSPWRYGFRTVLMLAIAYGASFGGLATLVGSPPNLIFAGQSASLYPELGEVGFLRWMLLGFPIAAVFTGLAWLYLSYVVLEPETTADVDIEDLARRRADLGPMGRPRWIVTIVFALTVLAWVFKTDLELGAVTVPGWATAMGLEIHDGAIALIAALALFLAPADLGEGEFVLDWKTAVGIPWEVLILFGGGFSLAAGFTSSGLAGWLGDLLGGLGVLPLPLLILTLCVIVIVGSEIASNTALTALILPVVAASADGLGLHPYWLMIPATLAASTGFMLPVATPPNAVAFASGYVTGPQMARVGLVLDIIGALLVTAASLTLLPLVFGL